MNLNSQSEAKRIWDSYMTEATKFTHPVQHFRLTDIFGLTTDLLREAINCYANGLANSTVVMCRSTIDTGIFEYLEHEIVPAHDDKGNVVPFYIIRRDRITNRSGKYFEDWKKISNAIKKSDLFTPEELDTKLKQIYELRDKGNFVAHLFQRSQEEADIAVKNLTIMTWLKDNIDISNIKRWGFTEGDITDARRMLENNESANYKKFTSIEEAGETLQKTVDIILDILSRFVKNHDKYLDRV